MDLSSYLSRQRKKIDEALDRCLPSEKKNPSLLHRAMRYAVFSGGKRIRPVLALASCEVVGGKAPEALPAACALELIHSYSLVHDDLPCMDDDDFRREKQSCHKKFGEHTAVLAGDALLTLAFQQLASFDGKKGGAGDLKRRLDASLMVARAAGARGMVGGQAVDMEYQDKEPDLSTIQYIHTHKTGALIAVSARVGACLGGGTRKEVERLYHYGMESGLLFQIVDDILDREGYAKLLGVSEAMREAEALARKAKACLAPFGKKAWMLEALADFILRRKA
ncbi:MAG: polyprenyl synthetase family protein [Candidatus Omnitrophica bacterium]|nr:polyprenyl synthetase family protein [Candidatus Omnitrophota bacterium]